MEVTQALLVELLKTKNQFTIPIYQRTYSWQIKQCQQLFDDILKVGQDSKTPSHFIGSIVYFIEPTPETNVTKLLVIDGQQRLTTVSLILLALIHYLKENEGVILEDEKWEGIQETYLINKERRDESKFKLLLTHKDKTTFTNLVDEDEMEREHSKRVFENYEFFKNKLCPENVQAIYDGIKKLIVIDVMLEKGKDNPQLIYESLNSKGLDLSQADLIRNYILMGEPLEKQNSLYKKYWSPMEERFGENIDDLAKFIRDYLTMKESSIPNINLVYETYKRFLSKKNKNGTKSEDAIEDAIKDLDRYSKFYVWIALSQEPDADIAKKLKELNKLEIKTSYPFLLAVYSDYENGCIHKKGFIEIISLVSNYVFRRAICGIAPNSLNKTFATLYNGIKNETYLESIKAAFLSMDGNKRFPSDTEFIKELKIKNVYHFKSSKYLLESLENSERKELVNTGSYTIEHILPQNEDVSLQWQQELGKDWEKVKDEYLHSLGNLTLTGYNSELSDKPFAEKKSMEGGFDKSPLFLNESVREATTWNEDAILARATKLAERACAVWKRPPLPNDKELQKTTQQAVYTIEDHENLQGDILELYKHLEERVLNLNALVKVEFTKEYIAFKLQTTFFKIYPRKTRLRLILNIEFDRIKDPKGMCKDYSQSPGKKVEVGLENLDELDYIMELIEQTLDHQNDD